MRVIDIKLFRELWRLRGQALAIAMVVASGVVTLVVSLSTLDSLRLTQQHFYSQYRFAQVFTSLKRAPDEIAARIATLPGVKRVQTRVEAGATIDLAGFADPISARVIAIPDGAQPALNRLYLHAGRLPRPGRADEAVVSDGFAEAHRLQPGMSLRVIINGKRQRLRIVGIAVSPEFIYQIRPGDVFPDYKRYAILWMNQKPLASAFDMYRAFNNLSVTLDGSVSELDVIDGIDRVLQPYGGHGAYGREDQYSHRYVSEEIKMLGSLAGMIPVIFLGVAAFLLNVVFSRMIHRQREQIGVLKAFGYSDATIARHYLILALLIVAGGCAIGLAVGAWLGHGMAALYSKFYRFPFLDYVFRPSILIWAITVTAAAALTGTLRAVLAAARLPPAEAMHAEPPARYRATLLERVGGERLLDQPSRMIARHLERQPLRALLSIVGIAFSAGIMMIGSFQEDAVDYMMDVQFSQASHEDLTLNFTDITGLRAIDDLRRTPGVQDVEPIRSVPVRLRYGHRSERTGLIGVREGSRLHAFLDTRLQPIKLPPQGMVLTDYLADQLRVVPGDTVTVETLEGRRRVLRIPVVARVQEYIGTSAYMRLDALDHAMQDGHVVNGAFLAIDSAYRQAIYDKLKVTPRVAGVTIREVAMRSFYETMGETLLIFAFVNTLLAGSITFGVVYNSARINFSERARELASLRVLGFTRGEVAYILLGEMALLVVVGIPLGFLVGRVLCAYIAHNLVSELYRVPLIIEPSTYSLSAAVVLAAALLSGIMMLRRVYTLDLVSVLKTKE